MKRRRITRVLQLGISVAVLGWLLRETGKTQQWVTFEVLSPWWLLFGLGCGLIMACLSGLRWWLLLRVQGIKVSWAQVASCAMAGLLFDAVMLGAAAGDLARALLLNRLAGVPVLKCGVSLLMDHLSGLMALVLMALGFTLHRREMLQATPVGEAGLLYLGLFILGAVITLLLTFTLTEGRLKRILPERMPGRAHLTTFAVAWQGYAQNWRQSLLAALVSVPLLLAHFSVFFCMMRAMGAQVSWVDVMAIMPVVDAVSLLPISFSGLGIREVLFVHALGGESDATMLTLGGVVAHLSLAVCGVAGWFWSSRLSAHYEHTPTC